MIDWLITAIVILIFIWVMVSGFIVYLYIAFLTYLALALIAEIILNIIRLFEKIINNTEEK